MTVTQPCPACGADTDVSIFSPGQRTRCGGCGHRFEVTVDVPSAPVASARPPEPPGPSPHPEPPEAPESAEPPAAPEPEVAPERSAPRRISRRRVAVGLGLALGTGGVWWGTGRGGAPVQETAPLAAGATPGVVETLEVVVPEVRAAVDGVAAEVLEVPLSTRIDGDPCERAFDFQEEGAGRWTWTTWRGDWSWADGGLEGRPAPGDPEAPEPRAFMGAERYLAEGLAIEATVRLRGAPGDWAALTLYRNRGRHLTVTARLGAAGAHRFSWDRGQGEVSVAVEGAGPLAADEQVRLALEVQGGVVRVSVDGRPRASVPLGRFTDDDWGKVGVGCRAERCRFESLRVRGRSRPAPASGG